MGRNLPFFQKSSRLIDQRKEIMSRSKIIQTCQMCGLDYQMGPSKYEGKYISRYKLNVCNKCYEGNWDGWAPHYEEKLLAHLKEKNISAPERNKEGWYPRD